MNKKKAKKLISAIQTIEDINQNNDRPAIAFLLEQAVTALNANTAAFNKLADVMEGMKPTLSTAPVQQAVENNTHAIADLTGAISQGSINYDTGNIQGTVEKPNKAHKAIQPSPDNNAVNHSNMVDSKDPGDDSVVVEHTDKSPCHYQAGSQIENAGKDEPDNKSDKPEKQDTKQNDKEKVTPPKNERRGINVKPEKEEPPKQAQDAPKSEKDPTPAPKPPKKTRKRRCKEEMRVVKAKRAIAAFEKKGEYNPELLAELEQELEQASDEWVRSPKNPHVIQDKPMGHQVNAPHMVRERMAQAAKDTSEQDQGEDKQEKQETPVTPKTPPVTPKTPPVTPKTPPVTPKTPPVPPKTPPVPPKQAPTPAKQGVTHQPGAVQLPVIRAMVNHLSDKFDPMVIMEIILSYSNNLDTVKKEDYPKLLADLKTFDATNTAEEKPTASADTPQLTSDYLRELAFYIAGHGGDAVTVLSYTQKYGKTIDDINPVDYDAYYKSLMGYAENKNIDFSGFKA